MSVRYGESETIEVSFVAETPEEAREQALAWATKEPQITDPEVFTPRLMRPGTFLWVVPVLVTWTKPQGG